MLLVIICQQKKLSKAQISKIIKSGLSFDSWLAHVGKKH